MVETFEKMTSSEKKKPELKQMPTMTSIQSYSTTTMEGHKVMGASAHIASNHQESGRFEEKLQV